MNLSIFFLLGEGEGGVRGAGRGGDRFFIENPRTWGVLGGGRGRRAGRVSAANWGIFGGGFLGAEMSTKKMLMLSAFATTLPASHPRASRVVEISNSNLTTWTMMTMRNF